MNSNDLTELERAIVHFTKMSKQKCTIPDIVIVTRSTYDSVFQAVQKLVEKGLLVKKRDVHNATRVLIFC